MNASPQENDSVTNGRTGARRGPAAAALLTDDGVRIQAVHRPRVLDIPRETAGESGFDGTAVVVAHGFSGSLARPAVRRVAAVLAAEFGVVTFSFRGHGRSGGRSTVGDLEVLDVEAAVAWARSLGYRRVVTLGFSMGGAVVLRHAALHGGVAAVAAVSAPGRWYYKGTAPMRRLHWAVQRPAGRFVARWLLGTRIHGEDWRSVPLAPRGAAGLIAAAGVPLLVVHGDADRYFPVAHARGIHASAGGGRAGAVELWIEPGMGHAENAAEDQLVRRIGGWLGHAALASGPLARVPSLSERDEPVAVQHEEGA